jgi:hypothetical protein
MSIQLAESLKQKLTGQWVVVDATVPELRRFAQWTGQVKTVNMNCRALVEFDGPADIGWYDIDPEYLTIVDGPRPKSTPAVKAKVTPAATDTAKPGKLAREPDIAATSVADASAHSEAQPASSSIPNAWPLPTATATAESPTPPSAPSADRPAPAATPPATAARALSPIELIRQQQAAKRATPSSSEASSSASLSAPDHTAATTAPDGQMSDERAVETPAALVATPDPAAVQAVSAGSPNLVTGAVIAAPPAEERALSPIELIRRQQAAKRAAGQSKPAESTGDSSVNKGSAAGELSAVPGPAADASQSGPSHPAAN